MPHHLTDLIRKNPTLFQIPPHRWAAVLDEACARLRIGKPGHRLTDTQFTLVESGGETRIEFTGRVAAVPVDGSILLTEDNVKRMTVRELVDRVGATVEVSMAEAHARNTGGVRRGRLDIELKNGGIVMPIAEEGDNFARIGRNNPAVINGTLIGAMARDTASSLADMLNAPEEAAAFALLVGAAGAYRDIYPTIDPDRFAALMRDRMDEATNTFMQHGCDRKSLTMTTAA